MSRLGHLAYVTGTYDRHLWPAPMTSLELIQQTNSLLRWKLPGHQILLGSPLGKWVFPNKLLALIGSEIATNSWIDRHQLIEPFSGWHLHKNILGSIKIHDPKIDRAEFGATLRCLSDWQLFVMLNCLFDCHRIDSVLQLFHRVLSQKCSSFPMIRKRL